MYAIIRSQKLHTVQAIGGLESHLKRQYLEDNVDPERSHLNKHLMAHEGYETIVDGLKKRLSELNITPRKNGVLAIEYVLTASPEFFDKAASEAKVLSWEGGKVIYDPYTDGDRYLNHALDFIIRKHGGDNILSTTVHRDESNLHMHVVVVPVDPKGKLNARHFLGGREKMRQLQDDYHKHISSDGLFKDLQRGKRKGRGAVEEYIQRTSPQIGDMRRSLSEMKSSIENEENALYERLQQLENTRKELAEKEIRLKAELERIRLAATLHKPDSKIHSKSWPGQRVNTFKTTISEVPAPVPPEVPARAPQAAPDLLSVNQDKKPENQHKKIHKRGRKI